VGSPVRGYWIHRDEDCGFKEHFWNRSLRNTVVWTFFINNRGLVVESLGDDNARCHLSGVYVLGLKSRMSIIIGPGRARVGAVLTPPPTIRKGLVARLSSGLMEYHENAALLGSFIRANCSVYLANERGIFLWSLQELAGALSPWSKVRVTRIVSRLSITPDHYRATQQKQRAF